MARLVQELRDALLQAAISGGLTEQDITDTSIIELLDNNTVKCFRENDLYDVPENWGVCRLKDIVKIKNGFTPKRTVAEYWNSPDIPWFTVDDIHDQGRTIDRTRQHISNLAVGNSKDRILPPDTILLCCTSATIGNYALTNIALTTNQQWNGLVVKDAFVKDILSRYMMVWASTLKPQMMSIAGSTTFPFLSTKKLGEFLIPLPPIEEQQRIVDRVDELMAKIDEFEVIENELEELKASFPGEMKEALLQAAMEGKLTEQLSEDIDIDEYLSEVKRKNPNSKKCEEITEEDILFDIPDNWRWIRFGSVVSHNTGKALNSSNKEGEMMEYITTSNLYWNRFELENLKKMPFKESEVGKCTVSKGDLLVCEGGDVGRAAIWTFDFNMRIQNHIHRIRAYSELNMMFYYHMFYLYKHIGYIAGKGIGIKGLSTKTLRNLMVPLPPLEEQQRIVDRLDALLPLCDELEDLQ